MVHGGPRVSLSLSPGYTHCDTFSHVQFSRYHQLWIGGVVFMDHSANTAIDADVIDKAVARIDYARQKTGRSCGSCSMCCYVMGVEDIDKPKSQWCRHCKPVKGCTIYATRPAACKTVACS